jgi:drug/metabolite transporter (DMT)-like permease
VKSRLPTTYLLLVVVVVIWGSYPTLVKLALRDMPPFTLAALRCTLASALLAGLFWRGAGEDETSITRADVPGLVVLGLAGIAMSTGIYYLGVQLTTASNAVILTASTPVLVALGGHLFFAERLSRLQWAGVACSAAGVLLTVSRGNLRLLESPPHPGDAIVVLGQVGWATYTLYGKRVLTRLSPRTATLGAYLVGTAVLVPLAVIAAPAFPQAAGIAAAGGGALPGDPGDPVPRLVLPRGAGRGPRRDGDLHEPPGAGRGGAGHRHPGRERVGGPGGGGGRDPARRLDDDAQVRY